MCGLVCNFMQMSSKGLFFGGKGKPRNFCPRYCEKPSPHFYIFLQQV